MPGSVSNASVTAGDVLPFTLCKAYEMGRSVLCRLNDYQNGESQRSKLVTTSRKQWRLSKHISPADMAELRAYFIAKAGSHKPFFYYDLFETSPKYSYDETGVASVGRYTVRFEGILQQIAGIAICDTDFALIEIA